MINCVLKRRVMSIIAIHGGGDVGSEGLQYQMEGANIYKLSNVYSKEAKLQS